MEFNPNPLLYKTPTGGFCFLLLNSCDPNHNKVPGMFLDCAHHHKGPIQMTSDYTKASATIVNKFRLLHEAFTDLNNEIATLHSEIPLRDSDARQMFVSLSRMLAFSDQVHLTLSLMGEDVKAVERATADPTTLMWNEQVEECLDEWFSHASMNNGKVH